ncbi:terpene synthase family protein [Streptomyces sp. CA-181903]|uniref:terpene synthase family protein n=1 Tax=Streptomyces sp. CA-181903 TaxID=3240055 RepID=UPI003D921A47
MKTTIHTSLPVLPLYCPFPVRRSPHAEAVGAESLLWMRRFDLFKDDTHREYTRRARVGDFVGFGIPDGCADTLQAATNYCNWLFAFDDALCDEKLGGTTPDSLAPYLARMSRMLHTPEAPLMREDKWAASLLDIRNHLARQGTPAQVYRWVDQVDAYFSGLVWEAAIRQEPRSASLDDYLMMWQSSSAALSALAFIEIAQNYVLTAEEYHDPRVHALHDLSVALIAWHNDITSYNKEAFREQYFGFPEAMNLVPVLARHHACTPQQALLTAASMHDRAMRRMQQLAERTIADSAPHLARYVRALTTWVAGSLHWHLTSGRYNDPNDPGQTIAPRVDMPAVVTRPSGTARLDEPLTTPVAAWWWNT